MQLGYRERLIAGVVGLIMSAPLVAGIAVWAREGLAGAKERLGQGELTA